MKWKDAYNVWRVLKNVRYCYFWQDCRSWDSNPCFLIPNSMFFPPFALLPTWCLSVTVTGFMLHSYWFLIITSLSWHLLHQRLSVQTPHLWQTLTRLKGSSGPLWGGVESCRCSKQAENGRLVSHVVIALMDLSWTDCSVERLQSQGSGKLLHACSQETTHCCK